MNGERSQLAADHGRLAASLRAFTPSLGYDLSQLRRDVDRFVFVLGGSDGEPLFGSHGDSR